MGQIIEIQKEAFDLVLMDIMLPGKKDGLEAIAEIRQMKHCKEIPIFALTALVMEGDRGRCLEAGATEHISKPIDVKVLIEIINLYYPSIEKTI